MDRRIEDKVMFGSDSERDIDDYVINKFKGQLKNGEVEYLSETESDSEYESDEEGEDEMEEEEGEDEMEEESELEFDRKGSSMFNKTSAVAEDED
jgi:hypothetical protein